MNRMVWWCAVIGMAVLAAVPATASASDLSPRLSPRQASEAGDSQAAASARRPKPPQVTLSLPGRVNERASIPISWSSKRLGKKYRLVIQRPVGTARVWKTLLKLGTRSGAAELPAQTLGVYRYRLAAFKGRRLLAQQIVRVGVFGPVPFSVLFRDGYLETGRLETGVYATPSVSFPYIGGSYVGDRDRPNRMFSVSRNRCTAVHIGFVLGETPGEGYSNRSSMFGVMTLVQQSRAPISAEVPLNGIGSIDAELVPGQTWSVLVAENHRDGKVGGPTFYFDGYAICSSPEPLFT